MHAHQNVLSCSMIPRFLTKVANWATRIHYSLESRVPSAPGTFAWQFLAPHSQQHKQIKMGDAYIEVAHFFGVSCSDGTTPRSWQSAVEMWCTIP